MGSWRIRFLCVITAFFMILSPYPSSAVSDACSGLDEEGAIASPSSGLYMAMPDGVYQLQDVTATVFVKNPEIKSKAKIVSFYAVNVQFHSVQGGKQILDNTQFTKYVTYSGEESFDIGMRNFYYSAFSDELNVNELYATFYDLKPVPTGEEYTAYTKGRRDEKSPWYDFDCGDQTDKMFCNGAASCSMCVRELGQVKRTFKLLPAKLTSKPPATPVFKPDARNAKPGEMVQNYDFKDDSGGKYKSSQLYISVREGMFNEVQKYVSASKDSKTATVAAPSGGMIAGNAYEVRGGYAAREMTPCEPPAATKCTTPVQYQMDYTLMAELNPAGSGLMQLTLTKTDYAPPNDVKAAVEKAITEAKETMKSFKAEPSGATDYKGKVCYWPTVEGSLTLKGRITDGFGNPMPYMKVEVDYQGKVEEAITDKDGNYEASLKIPAPDEENPPEVVIRPKFEYWRDGKNQYTVIDMIDSKKVIFLEKTVKIKTNEDLRQGIDFKIIEQEGISEYIDGDIKYSSDTQLGNMIHFARTYTYTAEAVEYALTVLKSNLDYKLPVEVYSGGDGTYYDHKVSSIFLTKADADYKSPEHPKNIEWHEFGHHIMYAQYGGWPDDRTLPQTKNHYGYINPSTADSYLEGFAEFMSLIIAENSKSNDKLIKPPEVYCIFGSMEKNYKVWDKRGYNEEFAVAGYLWDLHDKNNEGDDKVTLSMDDMWPVLKVKRANFYEYHKAFREAFLDKADAIDKIAVMHGFFADTRNGNGKHDPVFEPLRWGNKFVDYGEGDELSVFIMEYDPGEVIGRASNYNRNRNKAGFLENAYIKIPDTDVKYYKVKVHFNKPADGPDYEYLTEARQGLMYLQPLPDGEDATITVTPDSLDYSGTPYVITSKELDQKYYDAPLEQGYMDEHAFNLQPTGTSNDPPRYPLLGALESEYTWDTEKGYEGNPEGGGISCCCIPGLPAILALLTSVLLGVPYIMHKK